MNWHLTIFSCYKDIQCYIRYNQTWVRQRNEQHMEGQAVSEPGLGIHKPGDADAQLSQMEHHPHIQQNSWRQMPHSLRWIINPTHNKTQICRCPAQSDEALTPRTTEPRDAEAQLTEMEHQPCTQQDPRRLTSSSLRRSINPTHNRTHRGWHPAHSDGAGAVEGCFGPGLEQKAVALRLTEQTLWPHAWP